MNDMRTMLIKDLGIIVTGNTPSKSEPEFYNSNDIHFIKPDLIGNTGITQINHSKEYISEKARKKARVVRKNTVLVTCIGNIGKVGFVEVDEVAFNQQINAIIPNKYVLPRYLAYALLANQQRLESIANAPVVPIINKTQFENFDLSIHDDLTEQDKITRILDNISKELMFRQKQINEYDQLIKSRFVEMFGQDLKGKSIRLGDLAEVITKGTTPTTLGYDFVDDGVNFIKVECITETGKFIKEKMLHINEECNEKLKRSKLKKDDILFSIAGAIGRTAIVTDDILPANTNQALSIIRLRKDVGLNVEFLNQVFKTDLVAEQIEKRINGVAQMNVSLADIGNLKIIRPTIERQNEFAKFVQQVDKLKFVVQKSLDETQKLFDSLMQEYFG